ncbi:MAG: M3 family oligoendopeptidase [Phycisphaerales bacterium]|jgi:oligoendopeptidase F|nr:M3 family oligoendopeptidase [Phycisphaerales bacterium]
MLAPFTPASDFVPANLDASTWANLKPLYDQLITRDLHCVKCLQRLIMDRSELDAAVSEVSSVLYINMTCHSSEAKHRDAYLAFVEHVEPPLKQASFDLDKRIASSPFAGELDQQRFGVYLRDLRNAVALFRPENIAIETEIAKLSQEYQSIAGAMTVQFDGQELPLPRMAPFQESTDRAVRERAWRAVAERRLADRGKIEDLFDKLLDLRHQVARNAGFANYRDYAHKAKRRFDYTPDDCHSFAKGVAQHIVPAMRQIDAQRKADLGVSSLRPWDMAVDVKGRAPLKPFENVDDFVAKTQRVFDRMDPSLGSMFRVLAQGVDGLSCLDLDSRKGKAPGGYQASRDRVRVPFIFMNAAGVQRDVETMVHEAGHAFHSMLCRTEPLLAYRSEIPLEFCEVASMSMELTAHDYLDEYYGSANAPRAVRKHIEGLANILPWIATIDQFQQWLYTNHGHSRAQRQQVWLDLIAKLGSDLDWSGLEDFRASMWQRQTHLFTSPFYYIEYGIAQLGALQLWANYRRDAAKAIADYKKGLSLGGSRPLGELFTAAGLNLDFSPTRIQKTWSEVETVLAKLPS